MAQLKQYYLGNAYPNKYFYIDTNVLSAIHDFYYYGHCSNKNLTSEIINMLTDCLSKGYGILYDDAILEASFDYGKNLLNSDKLNLYMVAIDTLILDFNLNNLHNHKGAYKPETSHSSGLEPNYSITTINLLNPWKNDGVGFDDMFLLSYSCVLKINELAFSTYGPIEKFKKLFEFMSSTLNCIMSYELLLGQMLFIGNNQAKSTSQGILKIEKPVNIKKIINSLWDITSYRRAQRIAQMTELNKEVIEPQQLIYITYDKALQNYIEVIDNKDIFMGKKLLVSFNISEDMVASKFKKEFSILYNDLFLPEMKRRSFQFAVTPWKINMDIVKSKIIELERQLEIVK